MIILNFAHPLSEDQVRQIEDLTRTRVDRLVELPVQFDPARPFGPQARALVDSIPLDQETLEERFIVVNPPSLASIAVLVLAELHGRMGYFPPVLRMRRVEGELPPRFEVAEIISLEAVWDRARRR